MLIVCMAKYLSLIWIRTCWHPNNYPWFYNKIKGPPCKFCKYLVFGLFLIFLALVGKSLDFFLRSFAFCGACSLAWLSLNKNWVIWISLSLASFSFLVDEHHLPSLTWAYPSQSYPSVWLILCFDNCNKF